jgi:4-amino-4-deoxy-L-arabinose transferase-like glycosyltransferase
LTTHPPPVSESFKYALIINNANTFTGHYHLGHPFFLALGIWLLHTPYLFPVLFAVFLPFLIYAIAQLFFNREVISAISAFLLSMSPFFLFTSSTLLSHSEAAFFLVLFIWLFFLSFKTRKTLKKVLFKGIAGICIGLVFNTRPLTAIAFAIPIMIFSLLQMVKRKDRDYFGYAAMLVGGLLLLSITFWYNYYVTGSYFSFPYQKYNQIERLGFGPIIYNYSHTIIKGINNGTICLLKLFFFTFGSPIGFLFFFPYVVKKKWIKEEIVLFGIILSVMVLYIFYYGAGVSDTGPVYFYELLIPVSLLSGRGVVLIHDYLKKTIKNSRRFIPSLLIVITVLCYTTFFPEKAITLRNLTSQINEPYRLIKKNNIHRAVIFIHSLPQVGWVYNPPIYLPGSDPDIIYCYLNEGPVNEKVLQAFPNRNYYIITYDGEKSTLYPTTPEILTKLKSNKTKS